MPPAEQRRRCSYRSIEPNLCVLGLSPGFRAVWAIVLFHKLRLRPPCFFLRRHRRGTLCYTWYVCRLGRGWCPGRHSLRFTIYRISRSRRQSPNSRLIASGTLAQCEHAMPTSPNSSKSIPFSTKISDFFRRLDCGSNSPRPTMKMPSW